MFGLPLCKRKEENWTYTMVKTFQDSCQKCRLLHCFPFFFQRNFNDSCQKEISMKQRQGGSVFHPFLFKYPLFFGISGHHINYLAIQSILWFKMLSFLFHDLRYHLSYSISVYCLIPLQIIIIIIINLEKVGRGHLKI